MLKLRRNQPPGNPFWAVRCCSAAMSERVYDWLTFTPMVVYAHHVAKTSNGGTCNEPRSGTTTPGACHTTGHD